MSADKFWNQKTKNFEYEKLLKDYGSLKVERDELQAELSQYKNQTMICQNCNSELQVSYLLAKNYLQGKKVKHCPNCQEDTGAKNADMR